MRSITVITILFCGLAAHAADRYYVGPDNGNWNNANNWSATDGGAGGAGVPAAGDIAHVNPSSALTVNFDGTYSDATRLSQVLLTPSPSGSLLFKPAPNSNLYCLTLSAGAGVHWSQSTGTADWYNFSVNGTPSQASYFDLSGSALFRGESARDVVFTNTQISLTGGLFDSGANYVHISSGATCTDSAGGIGGEDLIVENGGHLIIQPGAGDGAASIIHIVGGSTVDFNGKSFGSPTGTMIIANTSDSSPSTLNQTAGSVSLGNTPNLTINAMGTYNMYAGTFKHDSGSHSGTQSIVGTFNQFGGDSQFTSVNLSGTFLLGAHATTLMEKVTESPLAKLELEIDGTSAADFANIITPPFSGDFISLAGNLTLLLGPDYTPQYGDSFDLISAPSITGTFSSYTFPGLPAGLAWQITQTSTDFIATVTTPEPSLAGLVFMLSGVAVARRRR